MTTTTSLGYPHRYLVIFSFLPSLFSISIWTSFVSSCLFLVGTMLAVSSVSVRWSHLLIFVLRYTIYFSYCVYYLLFSISFPPEAIFRSRGIGACAVTTDYIVATWVSVRTTATTIWLQRSRNSHIILTYLRPQTGPPTAVLQYSSLKLFRACCCCCPVLQFVPLYSGLIQREPVY